MIGLPAASTRLPLITSVRPGFPSLKMITPVAPAACALITFTPKLHPPRWIRAIRPAVNPVKSDDVHPLVELDVCVGGMMMPPAGCRAAVVVPVLWPGFHSSASAYVCATGEFSWNDGGALYA